MTAETAGRLLALSPLPLWECPGQQPDVTMWQPVAGPPEDDFEYNYEQMLTALLRRQWKRYGLNTPQPEMRFMRLWPEGRLGEWGSVQGMALLFKDQDLHKRRAFVLSSMLQQRNRLHALWMPDRRLLYVSPFFDWGLADYWESGYYDR